MAAVPTETRRAPRLAACCPAEIAFGAGRWSGVTEDLADGLVAPRAAHVRTLVLAARSQAAAGQVELAARTLRTALELAPEDVDALETLRAMEG